MRIGALLSWTCTALLAGCSGLPAPPAAFGRIDAAGAGETAPGTVYRIDVDSPLARAQVEALLEAGENERSSQGDGLYLWIDVGRSEALASRHPEWIAGMGSHEDWRSKFPGAPSPDATTRVGVHPWTPIWYRAVLEDRRDAIVKLLSGLPPRISGVFLCHVQGAPSACGCGNEQCRWTADYRMTGGPERIEGAPAAVLIRSLEAALPGIPWIPVWVTECEEHDQPGEGSTGYCYSVGCFKGLCWKESTKELEGLLAVTKGTVTKGTVALLGTEKAFGRSLERYAKDGGWIAAAARSLEEIPKRHQRTPLPSEKLLLVVEGEEAARAIPPGLRSRVQGVLTVQQPIDQSWSPRLIPVVTPPSKAPAREASPHGHGST